MDHARSARRVVFLTLSLLCGCAAAGANLADQPDSRQPRAVRDAEAGDSGAFLIGRLAGRQGDLDVAANAFLQILAHDPDNVEVRQQAFLACLLLGRPEAVKLAASQINNPVAEMLLGGFAAQQGDWSGAERRFNALPREGMTQIVQPLLVAWAQAGAGHTDTALATLKPYAEGDRFRPVYLFHAALIADLGQRDPEAGRLYATAKAEFGPPNLAVSQAEASWLARQGDRAAAMAMLDALAASSPDFTIVLPGLKAHVADRPVRSATDGMAEAYVALPASLQAHDALEPAALLLRLALDLQPDMTGARLLSAEIDEQARRPAAALATLAAISTADPLSPLGELRRAALLQRLDRADEALAVLTRLAAAIPDRPEPWVLRGAVLRGQQRYPEAVLAYTQAIARTPHPTKTDWPLYFERGVALERANRWPDAEADFSEALVLAPDQPTVLNYLGYSWTEQGRNLGRARQMIERAVALRPNDGAMLDSLGWVMLRQGDVAGAVHNLETAVELEPEDATINGHLGDAYSAANRKMEAAFQWRRALTLNPDPEERSRIADRLRDAGEPPPLLGQQATDKAQP